MARIRYQHRVKAAPHVAGIATPVNTVLPVITGDTAGEDCTTSNGTWTNSSDFTYQWYLDGVLLAGETASTITTDEAWADQTLTVTVYGGNGAGKIGATSLGVVLQEAAGYETAAVHVDGMTFLTNADLTSTDNGLVSYVYWSKIAAEDQGNSGSTFVSDPEGLYGAYDILSNKGETFSTSGDTNPPFLTEAPQNAGTVSPDVWNVIMVCAQTNLGAGSKIVKVYLADTDITGILIDNGASFIHAYDGLPFLVFGDTFGDNMLGDFADFWFAPGQFVDFSIEANRRKFVTAGGKPVDLGADGSTPTGTAPAIYLRRAPAAAASTYASNLATGGPFSTTGTLTNASSSPSD